MFKTEYTYNAIVDRVVDGDTIDLTVDLGLKITWKGIRVRLVGPNGQWFDAPEINRGTDKEKAAGRDARAWLKEHLLPGTYITIKTFKPDSRDSFGRWLSAIWSSEYDKDIATCMSGLGLGAFKE